jgi:hypothetical protein
MKVILESTDKIVTINGLPALVWEGQSESGIPCHAFITRIGVHRDLDSSQFEHELQETKPLRPEIAAVIPARLVL